MARKPSKTNATPTSADQTKWGGRIARAERDYSEFCKAGDEVVSRYRLEAKMAMNNNKVWRDKYNILYSSTETIKPSLYAQTPKPEITSRKKDGATEEATLASVLLENSIEYAIEDLDYDEVINNCMNDYLLPGLGIAWIRYKAEIVSENSDDPENTFEDVGFEGIDLDYVHYKDFLTSKGRVWEDIWWVARRSYLFKEDATKRFGREKASKLSYMHTETEVSKSSTSNLNTAEADKAVVWEIWDKRGNETLWYSEGVDELLDRGPPLLKLKGFFPCPRPLRAITTTDNFIPRPFFSQYRQQAETLDDLTMRIRLLSDALKLVGVFDSSQESLTRLLTGNNNKMVAVENWAQFSGNGGMAGSVQFLPVQEVATVLTELFRQREIAKNEIYEITGFSDIVRGISKASETLGAQEIKNQWAGGRVRMLQKEVQRFCRDIIRIMAEIIAEQFSDENLAVYSGFEPPPVTPEEQQAIEQYNVQASQAALSGQPPNNPPPLTRRDLALQQFKKVVELLRQEKLRSSKVGIETDSTIQPDEAAERKDRMDFLGAMGAYLQQAGPMVQQFPEMRGLLGAMMMFTARTFKASRPIEKEFDEFSKKLQSQPAQPPSTGEEGKPDDSAAKLQIEQMKQQGAQAEQQADAQAKKYEIDAKYAFEREKLQVEQSNKARELALREREVAVKEAELNIKDAELALKDDRADSDTAAARAAPQDEQA